MYVGSSPRGRGKLAEQPGPHGLPRLIPAWAGKTHTIPNPTPPITAHPRVGGENGTRSGPSRRSLGLIPAWAGKTLCCSGGELVAGAHPRVGGENRWWVGKLGGPKGSSPRGRGKLVFRILVSRARRLIPAWAGKTELDRGLGVGITAHPRVGGENGGP